MTDNDTGALRAHWLRFANQEDWIYQRHQPSPCGVVATPAEVRVGAGGGSATIAVVAACDWAATTTDGFIRVVAGATGSGNGTVTITVGPNASGGERVGELFIGSTLVPVRQPSLQLGAATVTYLHTDALGSVRLITDATGAEVARYHFQPFGADVPGLPATAIGQPVLFTGKERDAETAFGGGTALDYFGARYYQSQTGRFTSVDPALDIEKALFNPQLWNRYAYALNNPLKYNDPDGRSAKLAIMAAKAAHAVYKGYDVYSTVEGIVDAAQTIVEPNASTTERLWAVAALAGELSGATDLFKAGKGALNAVDSVTDARRITTSYVDDVPTKNTQMWGARSTARERLEHWLELSLERMPLRSVQESGVAKMANGSTVLNLWI